MATEADELVGSLVDGRYKILEAMASGSMGAVYKAERIPVGKLVAIKFLHASYANDSEFLARFERETRVMSKLAHPNCVSVVDFGVFDAAPYLVMEYVAGRTLRTIIDQGPVAISRAFTLARQIAAGLAHAHSQGITHRDVKPANIMISEEIGAGEHVRILDFGLARLRGAGGRDATQSNVVVGTPNYMAPEQTVGGGTIDARTDVYAVGIVLFEMIAGERPFKAEDTLSLLGMHRTAPVPRLTDRAKRPIEVPDGLQELIETAMAKSPRDRYQSAIELADAIDALGIRPVSATDPRGLPVVRATPVAGMPVVRATPPAPVPVIEATETLAIEPTLVDTDSRSNVATSISSPRATAARRAPSEAERKPASSSRVGIVLVLAVLGGGAYGAYYFQQRGAKAKPGSAAGSEAIVGSAGSDGSAASGSAPDPAGPGSGSEGSAIATVGSGSGEGSGSALAGSGSDGAGSAGSVAEGSGSGAGSGADEVEQAPDPGQATNPVPQRPGGGAEDEDDDAPKTQADLDKRAKPAGPVLATTIPDVIKLIQDNKRDLAFASLNALYKKQPKSAYIPFLLGNLYFDQRWWQVAMEHYRAAISRHGGYRSNAILVGNVITMLVSKKTDKQAEAFLKKTIGRPALPYLQAAARTEPNLYLRKYASALAKQMR